MSTFSEMKTELAARGFDDFSDARLGAFINQARAEIDRLALWPWREKSVTGDAPLEIADLGVIEAVINTSRNDERLVGRQYQDLLTFYGELDQTGHPWAYYRAWVNGTPVVATYPESSDTIGVQYWKVTADLSAADDEPASPDEVHSLIVDLAVVRGYRAKDNHEAARELRSEIEYQIQALLQQYEPGIGDDPGHIVSPGWEF